MSSDAPQTTTKPAQPQITNNLISHVVKEVEKESEEQQPQNTSQAEPQATSPLHRYQSIPLDSIKLPEHVLRQRINDPKLQELADDIARRGQLTPIIVRPQEDGTYQLVAGLRRVIAIDSLGQTHITAQIQELTAVQAAEITLIENLKRDDINPVDESEYFQMLQNQFDMPLSEIAARIGKSPSYVGTRLSITTWPSFLQGALASETLNLSQCTQIAKADTPQIAQQLFDWTLESGANVSKISQWRKELSERVIQHIQTGGSAETYEPPPVAPEITFVCQLCLEKQPFANQSVLSLCHTCNQLIREVQQQGHFSSP